ncbi:MAG: hypothetical protein AABZ74_00805 [Cyanobacteriota bacterium]
MRYYFVKKSYKDNSLDDMEFKIGEFSDKVYAQTIFNFRPPCQYILMEVLFPHDNINIDSDDIVEVSDELYSLLYSAKTYYVPAIALAFVNIMHYAKKLKDFSIKNLEMLCKITLEYYLQNQRKYPFFIAKANPEEIGWLMPNSYYWIVGYNKKTNEIHWVSDYDFIYSNDLSNFDIKLNSLKKLEKYPEKALKSKIYPLNLFDNLSNE